MEIMKVEFLYWAFSLTNQLFVNGLHCICVSQSVGAEIAVGI